MTTDNVLDQLGAADPGDPLPNIDDGALLRTIDQKVLSGSQAAPARPMVRRGGRMPDPRSLTGAVVAFVAVMAAIVLVTVVRPTQDGVPAAPAADEAAVSTSTTLDTTQSVNPIPQPDSAEAEPAVSLEPFDPAPIAPSADTGGTPLPDIANAIPGDEGADPLPLGTITELPGEDYLDFLFEFCPGGQCYRDAHFMDPDNPMVGSGPWTAGRAFHVRHGFPVTDQAPLGPGFDVVLYVTPLDHPGEAGGTGVGDTVRYTSDYVLRGESDACGPTYKSQTGTVPCEWFVHDFPDGLPQGRFAIWAFWEAPCSAWRDLGLTSECADPSEVMSLFRSGFDSPFDSSPPSFTERNESRSTPEELAEWYGDWDLHEDPGDPDLGPPVDASGAVANFSTTTPDIAGAVPGDDASGPLPLGVVTALPGEDYLDFLFEFCPGGQCYRDAHFMDPDNPMVGSGPWTAGRAFHVRHGFPARGPDPLGAGFDVVLYITGMDPIPGEFGGGPAGETVRYTSDYVLRGDSEACGPTYKTQTDSVTCEWFVHDFPDGLPDGRYDLWAFWEAPCWAWLEYGFVDSCTDPDTVTSMFSSGVNSPFHAGQPSFTEPNEARLP